MPKRFEQPANGPQGAIASRVGDTALQLTFDRQRVLRSTWAVCVLAELAFLAIDWFVNYGRAIDVGPIRRLCNITREDGLASWFAITQTFVTGLVLAAIWIVSRRVSSRAVSLGWLLMTGFFIYLAMDDGAMIHERVGSTITELRDDQSLEGGYPSYAWQIVFVPILAAFGVFMFAFLMRQLRTGRQRLAVILAMTCLSLAIGLDFIEGLDADHRFNLHAMLAAQSSIADFANARFGVGGMAMVVHFSKAIEETLEMLAFTLLLTAFLSHLMHLAGDVRVRFQDHSPNAGETP